MLPSSTEDTKIIMATTLCTARCRHCLFSSSALPKRFLSAATIEQIATAASERYLVLSGGEPFEHPEIEDICSRLTSVGKPYRIATAGHIDLKQFEPILTRNSPHLVGLSVGTDVFLRPENQEFLSVWQRNFDLLHALKVPYSITITLQDETHAIERLFDFIDDRDIKPQFFYIRGSKEDPSIAKRTRGVGTYFDIF
jgi:organic radical activating enzyme